MFPKKSARTACCAGIGIWSRRVPILSTCAPFVPTINYRKHEELARAIDDGARVRAFHAWTLLDNFQWAEGYTERYGLIYTDFRNQKRTIKDSGLWYGRVAASNRLDV